MDVSAVVTQIQGLYATTGPITLIGGAMVVLAVVRFGWSVVRSMAGGRR